jgi:hypothetical protein
MQFIRRRIAAPHPSESRSGALWEQLGWFSASKTYATSQQLNCTSTPDAKARHYQQENRFRALLSLIAAVPAILRRQSR